MRKERKRDWFKFWVHFSFGVPVGAIIGLRLWSRSSDLASLTSMLPELVVAGSCALAVGLIAGVLSNTGWDE